ncbi:MAG: HEPN domain-containing protein [Candidatus Paceibacterota bacterium]|jgi:HEPN domain-containing protein
MEFDKEKVAAVWLEYAGEKWKVAEGLQTLGHYSDALFYCHLAIECVLKRCVILKINDHQPYTHDLEKLALIAELKLTPSQLSDLQEINTFNIAGRYPEYKQAFYKKVTKEYFTEYFEKSKQMFIWLSSIR